MGRPTYCNWRRKRSLLALLLGLMAALYGCTVLDQAQPRGFAGYSFHSDQIAIMEDMNRSGYQLIESSGETLLYSGTWQSFPVQFSYGFNSGELTGGYIDVLELSEASWHSVGKYLTGKYPLSTKEPCQNTDKLCQIICTGDAKIIHLLSDDREVHVVRYFERTPRHPCGNDLTFVEEASAISSQ